MADDNQNPPLQVVDSSGLVADNSQNQPIKAVDNKDSGFKGGLGTKAITEMPAAKVTTPSSETVEIAAPPIKKGLGASQITPIVTPPNPEPTQTPPAQPAE